MYLCMYVCIYLVHIGPHKGYKRITKGIRSPGAEVTVSCEPLDVDAGI